ncbi:cytochrome o ubiquinol oxidase subunit IV [Acetobacter orleanensis]|uniref:Cytochrome bo(3) ubiquinol oxidase subunit 4 n=1 Tax=Acetobacter orleanensis TaxID=104099 RepID=A0A4Y3TN76_9PROT|nr:cytochrome o ubiquinol oxidase subunit IV [Acetobacter orleanensis]KXV62977.1 cytochrome C oxidase subunit III [Acetobacter orleanensis]PCD79315.1 cytochrome o ubiquinol oxidase subunit IV [Acetobacter orleanensis]GAN69801.1 cytochrome o ubiquinol oxidase subunit IV [Acetobacter orleanensis JCM 7639]GBR23193.1 cytochrome o ubiquinol oxidase subunit IV [Acetobacter orleanensis NRIC 0473]GEB82420.1 cytochrome o ubiquinol oxidase subunit IV [Acetobacter orleanensis]
MSDLHTSPSGESHGSVSSYIIGFVLAVILTVVAFGVVMSHSLSPSGTLTALAVLAFVQVLVHLHYFLHMGSGSEQRWNNMCFFFAVGFVVILIIGTMFIMNNTAMHMMSR